MRKLPIFLSSALLWAMPAHAVSIDMVGHIRSICQVADTGTAPLDARSTETTLAIFCNSSDGATVSATLLSGADHGYLLGTTSGEHTIQPGETSDIIRLATAFKGAQTVSITPIDTIAERPPVIMFEVAAD